jgi:tRNA pseudouridine32 synthase/23S rRNA pseudouridine746 synthase
LIPVIHADDQVIVVNKPSGLLSVPGRGPEKQDCVWHRVQAQFADALVVHRLDQATSGLLVLARGIESQRRLSRAFADRRVDKRYLAWVTGLPPDSRSAPHSPGIPARPDSSHTPHTHHTPAPPDQPGWNRIDLPILPDWPNRPRQIISPEGRPCLTYWRWLEQQTSPDRTLLELQPHTGRSHQLRVHLQAIGHPILGDDLYGANSAPASPALQLHAWRLTLPHPFDDRTLTLQAPLPAHWGQITC